jgi:putative Ig domain-containing protein
LDKNARSRFAPRLCAAIALTCSLLVFATTPQAAKGNCNSQRLRGSETCALSSTSANNAPTISGTPAMAVTTGQSYTFTPTASDADGNRLTFSIVNRPTWASFSSSTGRLSGTPSAASAGEYIDIRISVSDRRASASLAPFSIVVSAGNRAPTLSGTPPTSGREGLAYTFTPSAADADGDALSFSITNQPAWATFNTSTGRLSGTPGAGTVGTYANITIRVSDGTATVALPAFSIAVQQASMGSATLSWQPPTTRTDGSPLTNLAGYHIRYGTAPGSYPNVLTIPNGGITSAVVTDLPPATYYFVASAYDTTGAESTNTNPVSKAIN